MWIASIVFALVASVMIPWAKTQKLASEDSSKN